jgi:AmiR/NasT family two-component response regulator
MRLRDQAIGALNLFSVTESRFDPQEIRVVQSLADVATIAILQERSIARAEALTEQLQGALNSRIVIEQAKGALARIEGISVDEAFVRLRERARSSRQRLVDVAATVLAGN